MRTDTPMESLAAALERAIDCNSAHWHILAAAFCYAYRHPDWFASWPHCMFETEALTDAAAKAKASGDRVAALALAAAAELAHPESDEHCLFGGAS